MLATTRKMIKIYHLKEIKVCFMGYKLYHPSYHHLVKKVDGGSRTIKNGAVISEQGHHYLHLIEYYDPELYNYINAVLKKENEQGCITLQNLKTIHFLLNSFEREHYSSYNTKGKILIKEEYLKRETNLFM